jgi:hypothetical protein
MFEIECADGQRFFYATLKHGEFELIEIALTRQVSPIDQDGCRWVAKRITLGVVEHPRYLLNSRRMRSRRAALLSPAASDSRCNREVRAEARKPSTALNFSPLTRPRTTRPALTSFEINLAIP